MSTISPCNHSKQFLGSYCLATFPRTAASASIQRIRVIRCAKETTGTNIFKFGTLRKSADEDENTNLGTERRSITKDLSLALPQLGRLRRASDSRTVFVAGATGQIGARISQQLLRSGFNVRGGVRNLGLAQQLAEFAAQYGVLSRDEVRRLNAVECEFKDAESIAKAIGNAGKVVVTVGATEDGPRGKVTPSDALQVVEAATLANVGHVVVVAESGGDSKGENPFAGITVFFNKLFGGGNGDMTADSLLESVVDTDLNFTFLKAVSTEVDDFSPVGSIVLLSEGTYNEGTGKVSKSQLASVVAGVFENVSVAENKVVEVASITSAAPRPIAELLSAIPEDGRRAALTEARAKAEAEKREKETREQAEAEAQKALEDAQKAADVASQLEKEAKKLATQEARASANFEKAKAKAQEAAEKFKGLGFTFKTTSSKTTASSKTVPSSSDGIVGFFSKTFSGKASSVEDKAGPELPDEVKKGLGSFFSGSKAPELPPQEKAPQKASRRVPTKRIRQPVAAAIKEKPIRKGEPVQLLGGLFKQETIYVDE